MIEFGPTKLVSDEPQRRSSTILISFEPNRNFESDRQDKCENMSVKSQRQVNNNAASKLKQEAGELCTQLDNLMQSGSNCNKMQNDKPCSEV